MSFKKYVCLFLIPLLLFTGCGCAKNSANVDEDGSTKVEEKLPYDLEAKGESYEFNPHVYSPKLAEVYDKEWWDAFYNLVDAIRAGEDTFECPSEEIYHECMNDIKLGDLYPVACVWVSEKSNDGTTPYENGIGHIYYTIPKDEFETKRQAFEEEVTNILAQTVRTDYSDFEKCLAIYDYMTANFTYPEDPFNYGDEGSTHHCIMSKSGICCELGSAYAYLLLQCGVDAMEVQNDDELNHAWTYVILDGQGYFVDPTWALRENGEQLTFRYFLQTTDARSEDGFDMSTLYVPLFYTADLEMPEGIECPADDEKFKKLWDSEYEEIYRDKKTIRCLDEYSGEEFDFIYE